MKRGGEQSYFILSVTNQGSIEFGEKKQKTLDFSRLFFKQKIKDFELQGDVLRNILVLKLKVATGDNTGVSDFS